MTNDFETVCAALWASLGLPRPRAAGRGLDMTIDGRVVSLTASPDERHIVVSGEAGRLSEDPLQQDRQLRELMRHTLGLLVTNRAGLRLEEANGAGRRARVEAVCPCRADAVRDITRAIEDVLQRLDVHGATLNDTGRNSTPRTATSLAGAEESLIFRL